MRLVVELDGEVIQKITPHIGYLHRGVEKLSEHRTYHQTIPLTDRLDYLAPMSNNLGYVLAVEKLLDIEVPERAQTVRVIMAELTRLKSHLVWLACHALDIGAMTVFIYCFREREEIMNIYEKISGARMTTNYFRVGGLSKDVYDGFEKDVRKIIDSSPATSITYEGLLTKNTIWLQRTIGNGVISAEDAIDYGITGPALRGSGVDWDLRRDNPYSGYDKYDFKIPIGDELRYLRPVQGPAHRDARGGQDHPPGTRFPQAWPGPRRCSPGLLPPQGSCVQHHRGAHPPLQDRQ